MSRLPALLKLHEANPKDPDLHFMIAAEHVNAGQHAEALPWLTKYVALGNDVGAGYGLIAACQVALGDGDAARDALRSGIDAALRCGHRSMASELQAHLDELDEG